MARQLLFYLWLALGALPVATLADEVKLGEDITGVQTRAEFDVRPFGYRVTWIDWAEDVQGCAPLDLLVNLETSADCHWGTRPGTVTDPEARAIVEDALEVEADRPVDAIDAAPVEARRLDQSSQLQDREAIRDTLNDS